MNSSEYSNRRFVLLMLLAGAVTLFTVPARAQIFGTVTITCGEPSFPGTVEVAATYDINIGNLPYTDDVSVSIPGTSTAAEKCAAIAAAFHTFAGSGSTVIASGNTLTFEDFQNGGGQGPNFLDKVKIVSDTTGEGTSLTVTPNPANTKKAELVETPVTAPSSDCAETNHLLCVPPAGTTFSGAVFGGSTTGGTFPPFTFAASGDGVLNYGQILGQINHKIAKGIGIPDFCKDIFDPLTSSLPLECESAAFGAPGAVTVMWDGNTGMFLVNFGWALVPPSK